jgi:Transposase
MDNTTLAKTQATHILGIDIAKHKFDVALMINGKFKNKAFDNTSAAFVALTSCLSVHQVSHVHACMEATGVYWETLATYGRKKTFVSFIKRLKASGKKPKEIVLALMRKLITIEQSVLKSQMSFNAALHAN